jgi:NAD(P)H-quinone oxidoreductase subunit 5
LFLSAGRKWGIREPQKTTPIKIKPLQAIIVLFFGILGAFLFAYLTGKARN